LHVSTLKPNREEFKKNIKDKLTLRTYHNSNNLIFTSAIIEFESQVVSEVYRYGKNYDMDKLINGLFEEITKTIRVKHE
jgi:hypothetical protein